MKNNRPYVYLAGPIAASTDRDMTNWRNRATALLHQKGFTALDPLRGYNGDREYITPKDAVERDTLDIRLSRVMLRYIPPNVISEGSAQETMYANMVNTPVVVFGQDPEMFTGPLASKFLRAHIVAAFRTLEEAVKYIAGRWLLPDELPYGLTFEASTGRIGVPNPDGPEARTIDADPVRMKDDRADGLAVEPRDDRAYN